MTTYVNDIFNRADAVGWSTTPLGALPWQGVSVAGTVGTFTIESNQAKAVVASGGDSVAFINDSQADGVIGITCTNTVTGGGALAFRYTDANNFWILWADPIGNAYKLMKRVAGAYTQVGATGPALTAVTQFSVVLAGSSIKAYVNGALLWNVTDSFNQAGTSHGIRQGPATTGYYDNFYHESAPATVLPSDTNILYSPYNWDVTSARAKTINPGAYFKARLSGGFSGITLTFDTVGLTAPYPWIKYRVDGGAWGRAQVAATVTLPVASETSWAAHCIEVVVQSTSEFVTRWSPQNAHVSLTGITGNGVTPTLPVTRAGLNVIVFGDSITEGYKSLLNTTTPDGSDATVAYAHGVARHLGAEVGVVGFGGQGWTLSGVGGVPDLPTAYTSLWGSGPARNFTTVAPDLVVINIGENDNTANIVAAATSMLNDLLTRLPATTLVAVMRPFSGREAANLQTAIANVASKRVKYVDTTGWFSSADSSDTQHPYGYVGDGIAAKLAVELRKILNGGGMYLNVAGVARAVANVRR